MAPASLTASAGTDEVQTPELPLPKAFYAYCEGYDELIHTLGRHQALCLCDGLLVASAWRCFYSQLARIPSVT